MQLHWCKWINSWGESFYGGNRQGLPQARFRQWPGMYIFWLHGLQRWQEYWSLNHPQPVNGFHDYQSGKISQNSTGCLIKSLPMNVGILIILCDRIVFPHHFFHVKCEWYLRFNDFIDRKVETIHASSQVSICNNHCRNVYHTIRRKYNAYYLKPVEHRATVDHTTSYVRKSLQVGLKKKFHFLPKQKKST